MNTLERLAKVMLAALAVTLLAWVMVGPPYDAKRAAAEEAKAEARAEAEQAKKVNPAPGAEAILRRMIEQIQRGSPDYAHMSQSLSEAVRRQLPQVQKSLTDLGPLRSMTYQGGNAGNDFYKVTFKNGWLRWGISIGKGGVVDGLWFNDGRPSGPPTPKQIIDGYGSFSAGVRAYRTLTQLGVLLLAALIGRFIFRLRL